VGERLPRRLTAILYADVAGYSRLTGEDEDSTHHRLSEYLDLISSAVERHRGRVMHYAGDAVLAMFEAVFDALSGAVTIQNELQTRNQDLTDERKVQFRIGVNLGDVIEDRGDIYGDGVNVAARLESLADPGGICISESVRTAVGKKLDLDYEFMGEQEVKNIAEPVRAYRVVMGGSDIPRPSRNSPASSLPDKPSIAVLPFTNMSGDPEQEYFSDGISEDLITGLSRNRGLFVIARNSTFIYKGGAVNVAQVAVELGVRYVLEGSVRKAGNRVRVTAQLVDAETATHVWAERYDRKLDDIFAVQDEITAKIVSTVAPELFSAEMHRAKRKDVRDLDAWDYALRAYWHEGQMTKLAINEARRLALRATELDPGGAAGFIILAITHVDDAAYGWSDSFSDSVMKAYEAAQKAVELDGRDAQSHQVMGLVNVLMGRIDDAARRFEMAIGLNPNSAHAHAQLGMARAFSGEGEEGIEKLSQAMKLSPRDSHREFWFGWMVVAGFSARRFDEAIEWGRKAVDLNSSNPTAYGPLAASYAQAGRIDEARNALAEWLRLSPETTAAGIRDHMPWQRPEDMELYLDGLCRAGLPC
jgi:adenylate cyclase